MFVIYCVLSEEVVTQVTHETRRALVEKLWVYCSRVGLAFRLFCLFSLLLASLTLLVSVVLLWSFLVSPFLLWSLLVSSSLLWSPLVSSNLL